MEFKLKVNCKQLKQNLRNTAIDGACVLIFAAITYVFAEGFVILYAAYYNTRTIPTPDVFQTASVQFTAAISLVYLLLQTRKHRAETEKPKEQQKIVDGKTIN